MQLRKALFLANLLGLFNIQGVQAALLAGTSQGVHVVYDSVSKLTWTADANLLATLEAGNSNLVSQIIAANPTHPVTAADFNKVVNGTADWWGAKAFVNYLNSIDYAGSANWALPGISGTPQQGFNQTNSQLGELFYTELGGTPNNSIPANVFFTNVQAGLPFYWTGVENPASSTAWFFDTSNGMQTFFGENNYMITWAVTDSNLLPAPVPSAVWLLGSGLMFIYGLQRSAQRKLT